jgi:hypothetical protein
MHQTPLHRAPFRPPRKILADGHGTAPARSDRFKVPITAATDPAGESGMNYR